jgi:gliding motility-associated-like protein
LTGKCDHWTFFHGEQNRNNSVINLTSPGSSPLYVEATLDNLDAPVNSSPYFTVKPVPYICNNIPYTYNNGAFDNNGDSLHFLCINPKTVGLTTCDYPPVDEGYNTGFSLPRNPLACAGTFVFDTTNGQMSFTPDSTGAYVVTVLVEELRNIGGTWKVIGSVMRDIQIVVRGCNTPLPTSTVIPGTITGSSMTSGTVNACVNTPFGFCFDIKTTASSHILTVKDNHKVFGSSPPSVSYVGMYTDSVRGCFSWTPRLIDAGLKIFAITVTDSTCINVGIPISATYTIPIYIWPVTTILNDTIICPGDSVQLKAVGGGGFEWDVLPGGSGTSSLSTLTGPVVIAKPDITTSYTVHSTKDIYCSKNRDTVTVLVVPPVRNITIDTAACIGSTIQLFAPDTTASPGISTTFKWTPATYLSNPNVQNPSCTPLTTTTYNAAIIYGGIVKCASKVTVNVKALKYFKLLNKDTSVCKNVPITVRATGDLEYYYTWTPASGVSNPNILNPVITPDTTRTYTVTARHVACPDSSASFTVTVEQTPLVSAGPDKTICRGDTVQLNGTAVPANPKYTYQWTPATSVTNPNGMNTIFKGDKTTQMIFSASTDAGCTGSDTMNVFVVPNKFLKVSPDTGICPGDTAQLRVSGDSIVSIAWTQSIYLDNPLGFTPKVWPNISQYFTVQGLNQNNCRDTEKILVTVHPAANIVLPDSIILYPGESYQISPEGNCLYYNWFPPYGLNSYTISNPVASPDVNTRYHVVGTTEAGCKATDSMDIYVAYDSYITVPNAFTPGSGSLLKLLHLGNVTLKNFAIYNRWGIKVYETSDINAGWDGTYNGVAQDQGVFVYTVDAVTAKGKNIHKQGNITLLR